MNNYFGVMLDCSRNAVMNIPTLKRYIDLLSDMGYNMLMLYTEDTYEVEGQPYFGHFRGRYSVSEMKEIVEYGESKGIEMIPCIQTLAHLNAIFQWKCYKKINDCADILMIDEDETYDLIEDMFKTLRKCYKTDYIHIGMDEAHSVGMGRFFQKHGPTNRFEIISRHLGRVAEIAKKYGFKPMMWSDMFFRLANNGEYYTTDPSLITPEIAKLVPENVELVYWDYYSTSADKYDSMIQATKNFNKPVWFAGGAWTWHGFSPLNAKSLLNTGLGVKRCRENNVENIFITCWGDDGGEASAFSVLPCLFYFAELYRGNDDDNDIKAKFEKKFGIPFDDYMRIDLPSALKPGQEVTISSCDRVLLYSDPFMGKADVEAAEYVDADKMYKNYSEQLAKLADTPEYGYLFDYESSLCDVMELKFYLGIRTRAAYKAGDKDELRKLTDVYSETVKRLDVFYDKFRKVWMKEKKPFGFDVQDIRLGGLKQRLISCRGTICDYLDGKLERIEELEEDVLPNTGDLYFRSWRGSITSSVL